MRWISTLNEDPSLSEAVRNCTEELRGRGGSSPPDLVLIFAGRYPLQELRTQPSLLTETFPESLVVGCTAGGVVGDGREVEQRPALSVTGAWLPEVKLSPFHLEESQILPLLEDRDELQKTVGVTPEEDPQFILLPDPFSLDPNAFVKALDESFPAGAKIGGLASGGPGPGANLLFLGDKIYDSGMVGVALSGNVVMDTLVAQGCRPIGNPMFITQCQGPLLFQLDGKPALGVLRDLYPSLSEADQKLFQNSLFLGIAMESQQQEYHAGDFLIRNLGGVLEEEGAIAVGAQLFEGQVVQFHLRDKNTSAHDLEALCRRYQMAHGAEGFAEGVLLFSCLGRGQHLYGEADHDSKMLKKFLGDLSIGGFFCNGEIGPVHQKTFLHGYTSSCGLFRKKHS